MTLSPNDKLYVAIGLSWSMLFASLLVYGLSDDNGIKHIEWWRTDLAILVMFAGVLIPLYYREILSRIGLVYHTVQRGGQPTHN